MDKRNNLSKIKRRRRQSLGTFIILVMLFIIIGGIFLNNNIKSEKASSEVSENDGMQEKESQDKETESQAKQRPDKDTAITISAAGDFTLGTDETFNYSDSFVNEASQNGLSYFVKGLDDIFQKDDLTTVNLETTLTNATDKAVKKFRFKGDPSYAKILTLGGIEAVNLANNHIFDYLEKGYQDTMTSLKNENIGYFGFDNQYLTTVKGVKIGALGFEGWGDSPEIRKKVKQGIQDLRNKGAEIVLVHFHWGIERQYVPAESQKTLARYTIDSGADLVLGHHPHVVQGIEEYKGKFIVYSLGNFMFGGNRNPSDKDTYVFQQTFHLKNGELTDKKEINVVPFSISSVSNRNNYQPTLLTGSEHDRVKQKIIDVSNDINGTDWLVYDKDHQSVQTGREQ